MNDQKLENYLVRLEKSLGPISVSEKAEIITEIKSHVLEAQSRDNTKSTDSILASLGEPEQVASKYLMERGLEPKKPPKHPIVKWIILGFLGTISLILITFLIVLWKFTPIVKVSDDEVKLLGGVVTVEDSHTGISTSEEKDDDVDTSVKTPFIKNFDASKIKYLKIETGSQDIFITGSRDKTALVKLTTKRGYDETKCYYSAELKSDTLKIKIKQKTNWHHFGSCNADIDIKIPENTLIDSKVGSGDIKISNISNEIVSRTGSGNISIDSSSAKIESKTGSGDINLLLKPTSTKVTVSTQTGSGNITVKMPKETKVNVTHLRGSGKTYNEFGYSENPNVIINAQTGSGDFYAKKI
ncbi:MAG: DUF1700 domain-containing protein [Proteobacteria bacterium]|nr:DUF1700 domain-containing protein [Pseudomonadota bacterium]